MLYDDEPKGDLVDPDPGLDRFNAAGTREELRACCAAERWTGAVAAGRPYADRSALRARADAALAELTWDDIAEALAAHPRIGERSEGWSRDEQSGTDGVPDHVRADLAAGNRAYEDRFGHVFLICASGLTATQMLTALRARLHHDPAAEREVVRTELGKIAWLRLERLLDDGPGKG